MATIALYANKINQMSGLLKDVRKSVVDYKSELSALKTKTLTINKSVCDLEDVISSIQTCSQTQEQKIASLDTFHQNNEEFISEVVRVDGGVADIVNQRKDDFYEKYYYSRLKYEKNGWEDLCDRVGEWCKEHWKIIVTTIIVVAAVALIWTGIGGIVGAMALGALFGAGIGGLLGGTISAITGGSFWAGFENGVFSGAISGIISGGMGFVLSASGSLALNFGQTLLIGGVSGGGTSLISNLGDMFIKEVDMSFGQMFTDMMVSGTVGMIFAGVSYGISKSIGELFKNVSWFSEAKELFRIGKTSNSNYGRVTSYTTKNPRGISLSFSNSLGKSIFRIEFDVSKYLHYHLPSLFGTKAHIPLLPMINAGISLDISDYFLWWR